jgi:hypothetical protein
MIKNRDEIRKPLEVVPSDQAFHFYKGIGQYSGVTATSLAEFAETVQNVDFDTIKFHFERGDFQNWIKETVRDAELAQSISKIKRELPEESLKKELVKAIRMRIRQLEAQCPRCDKDFETKRLRGNSKKTHAN